jgi:hypothetical protein
VQFGGQLTAGGRGRGGGDITKNDLKEIVCKVVTWGRGSQGKIKWRAFVNTGMNLATPNFKLV